VVAGKLRSNARRDEETDAPLTLIGWLPLRIWEHETGDGAVERVAAALATRGHPRALAISTWTPVLERATEGA
jgi:DNA mismatch endonuclease (patch repair protein)